MRGWIRLRPGRWGATAGVALISVGLLSFNAFAAFTASTSVTHDVASGTMTLELGNTGAVTNRLDVASEGIAPGDTMQRTLTLTAGGSVSMSDIALTLSAPTSSLLDQNATHGLQIAIDTCDQQWTESGPPYTYTCDSGNDEVALAETSVADLIDAGTTSLQHMNVSGPNYLRITLSFPSTADDSYQDLTTQLDFEWSGVQRAGTNK